MGVQVEQQPYRLLHVHVPYGITTKTFGHRPSNVCGRPSLFQDHWNMTAPDVRCPAGSLVLPAALRVHVLPLSPACCTVAVPSWQRTATKRRGFGFGFRVRELYFQHSKTDMDSTKSPSPREKAAARHISCADVEGRKLNAGSRSLLPFGPLLVGLAGWPGSGLVRGIELPQQLSGSQRGEDLLLIWFVHLVDCEVAHLVLFLKGYVPWTWDDHEALIGW